MSAILGVSIVLLGTAFLFALVGILKARYALSSELTRKLVHIGVGLLAVSFPWTLVGVWPVLVVCAAGTLSLILARRSRPLRRHIDGVIGVRRLTLGELYFPATVGVMFLLARGDEVRYVIPLLVLTFADAAAAVIGLYYGTFQYSTEDGWKSAEGSLVFLVVAFFSAQIPLLLYTDAGRAETLVVAFLVAFMAMLVEAVCTKGFDNILVPITAFLVLQSSLSRGITDLVLQAVVACGMLAVVFLTRNRNTLSGSALLGIVLVGFLCWNFGGWQWLLAPLILFLANGALHIDSGMQRAVTAHFMVVRRVSEAGLAWLFLATMLHRPELIVPFVAAFSAQLAMLSMRQLRVMAPASRGMFIVALSVVSAWAVMFVPYAWLGALDGNRLKIGIGLLVATLAASVVFYRKLMTIVPELDAPRPWRTQALCGALASVLVLAPLYL